MTPLTFSISDPIVNSPIAISRQILSFLKMKEINSCKLVCKAWKNFIENKLLSLDDLWAKGVAPKFTEPTTYNLKFTTSNSQIKSPLSAIRSTTDFVVSGLASGRLIISDKATFKTICNIEAHKTLISSIKITDDYIVTGASSVVLWKYKYNEDDPSCSLSLRERFQFNSKTNDYFSTSVDLKDNSLLASQLDRIGLWDIESRSCDSYSHASVTYVRLCESSCFFSVSWDSVKLWDKRTRTNKECFSERMEDMDGIGTCHISGDDFFYSVNDSIYKFDKWMNKPVKLFSMWHAVSQIDSYKNILGTVASHDLVFFDLETSKQISKLVKFAPSLTFHFNFKENFLVFASPWDITIRDVKKRE